jgi:hypothetical protein
MSTLLIIILAAIGYSLLIIAFVRFFRMIHEGDQQIRRMIIGKKKEKHANHHKK